MWTFVGAVLVALAGILQLFATARDQRSGKPAAKVRYRLMSAAALLLLAAYIASRVPRS